MFAVEIVGWAVFGAVVGYFAIDMSGTQRLGKPAAMAIGALGAVGGGFLGYAVSGRSLLGAWTYNAFAMLVALAVAIAAVVGAIVLRRWRKTAHRES